MFLSVWIGDVTTHDVRRTVVRLAVAGVSLPSLNFWSNAMAFSDPITITLPTGGAKIFPRVGSGSYSGQFQTADGLRTVQIAHSLKRRNRHTIRLDSKKTVADVVVPTNNTIASMSAYLVIDVPVFGYTTAEMADETNGLLAYLTASTYANVTKLLGNES